MLGDHGALGENAEVDGDLLRHAIDLLESVRTQGENDPYWNARMGYSCLMAYSSAATAYEYAKRWLALAPDDPDAQKLVRDCEEYLEEGNSLELDWNEREEIIRRETIPPADDDILGHVKVHIDQQFGVYTQLLTDNSDPDYPLEIAVIPPRLEHDYYTLVTVGLSRHRMGFPEERREEKLERAELLINLPRDWRLTKADCREERWNWPIRMMLATAHFAMEDPEVKRYEIPASKLVLELGYSVDYEDEKEDFEPDEADTVELISGERMPWEQVKRDGIDYIALYYVNEEGKQVQILDAELA